MNTTATELMSIGIVAQRLGVSKQTIRNWELAGIAPEPRRLIGYDRRFYDEADVEKLRKIIEERRAANNRQPVEAA